MSYKDYLAMYMVGNLQVVICFILIYDRISKEAIKKDEYEISVMLDLVLKIAGVLVCLAFGPIVLVTISKVMLNLEVDE